MLKWISWCQAFFGVVCYWVCAVLLCLDSVCVFKVSGVVGSGLRSRKLPPRSLVYVFGLCLWVGLRAYYVAPVFMSSAEGQLPNGTSFWQ